MLEEFLGRPAVAPLLAKDYVDLVIDTDRMTGGDAVYERLKKNRSGGLPWLVILDQKGFERITGVGPGGNIGAPVKPAECEHFVNMIRQTRIRLRDAEIETIAAELEAHAAPLRRPRRR